MTVEERGKGLGLKTSCRLLGRTRQAYYKQRRRVEHRAMGVEIILQEVIRIRKQQKRIGARKLHHMMGRSRASMVLRWAATHCAIC